MTTSKRDIYQEVTDQIIEQMETAGTDWTKPWSSNAAGLPISMSTGKHYNGINVLLLGLSAAHQGFTNAAWGTFKQWKDRGGHIKKGSKGTRIVLFKSWDKNTGETDANGDEIVEKIPMIRAFTVFNADQVENVDVSRYAAGEPQSDNERIENAEQLVIATGADIRHGGNRACFIPSVDQVHMPHLGDFADSEYYYSTMFHELTHWSGGKKRLERDLSGRFGDESYAAEELIAEMGAAMLCAVTGIHKEPREDHAKYLNNWLKVLKGDKKAIFTASSAAQKAVDYLTSLEAADQAA